MPKAKGHYRCAGQELRKLRTLLHNWWHEHSRGSGHGNSGAGREAYLSTAMLMASALHLSQHSDGRLNYKDALTAIQNIWPQAFEDEKFLSSTMTFAPSLLADEDLSRTFLTVTNHRLTTKLFRSPLCPSFIYEAFSSPERRTSKDLLQDEKKLVDSRHLIAFTQVYTPDWVVDHLLRETLGVLLEDPALTLSALAEKRLLDPALGGGVFLVQSLDLLVAAYKKFGLSDFEAVDRSLKHNLFALDIDPSALATAALSLIFKLNALGLDWHHIKALLPLKNIRTIEDKDSDGLGSLAKSLRRQAGHPLGQRYDVVVANPPYLGRKLLPRPLKDKLRQHYPEARSDLSQAFLSMAIDLTRPGGKIGFITQSSFLHLSNAINLREKILNENQLLHVVELGSGVFPMLPGEKAFAALIVIKKTAPQAGASCCYLSLESAGEKAEKLLHWREHNPTIRPQSDFLGDKELVINFKRPQAVLQLRASLKKLGDIATLKQGLATTDNGRFLRYIWEVPAGEIPAVYRPYARGEGSERWWSPLTTLVFWESSGQAIKDAVCEAYPYLKGNFAWVVKNEDYYFRPGLTFSFVSKERLAVRLLPEGNIFDVGSSAIFIDDQQQSLAMLAYLNSNLATAMAHDLNPTINFQVGDLKKLIIPNFTADEIEALATLAREAIELKKNIFALTSPLSFYSNDRPSAGDINAIAYGQVRDRFYQYGADLERCEAEIDTLVMRTLTAEDYLSEEDRASLLLFSQRTKTNNFDDFDARTFCVNRFIICLLEYFFSNSKFRAAQIEPLSMNEEDRAAGLISYVASQIDLNVDIDFISESFAGDLTEFLCRHLPTALDTLFFSQPPILVLQSRKNFSISTPQTENSKSGAQPQMRSREMLANFRAKT